MKSSITFIFALLAITFYSGNVRAQKAFTFGSGPGPVISISENVDGKNEIVDVFRQTESAYFRDPQTPRFILVDKKGQWGLGIGGYVQTKIEYDFGGIVDNVDFFPSEIPTNQGAASSQYQMDITTSEIFIKLVGRSKFLGDFVVYTSANWRGNNNGFSLQNSYLRFKHLTLGYTLGAFMDIAACPPTIDFAGPAGMTFYRSAQVLFHYKFKSGLTLGAGLEAPDVDGISNQYTAISTQRCPNVPIFAQYAWNSNSHVRIGAIMRDISYSNLVDKKDKQKIGWGTQATLVTNVGKKLQLFGQYTVGEGICSMFNELSTLNVDIVPNPNVNGNMMLLLMNGWYAGGVYTFNKKFFAGATYGQSSLISRNGYAEANPTQYKRGQYLVTNLFYNATNNLQLGVEYIHGWKTNFNEDSYNANRVNLSAQFSF